MSISNVKRIKLCNNNGTQHGTLREPARFASVATLLTAHGRLMPTLAVWLDGAPHFCAGAASRKGKNLARDAHCVLTAASHKPHRVVEGKAAKVRDGALYGDGAPTAGPPPYEVYAVTPATVFGFGEDESFSATRWRF